MKSTNRDNNIAANNSNRGILIVFTGATLDLLASNVIVTLPVEEMIFK